MNASMKTRRPPRRLSDSLGDAPIDRMPSRRRFKIGGHGILGTYSGGKREASTTAGPAEGIEASSRAWSPFGTTASVPTSTRLFR